MMEIREIKRGTVRVVAPVGRIDSGTSGELERALARRVGDGEADILVDLLGVEYISSAGLGVLLKTANAVREKRGRLVLCSLGRSVREVFQIAGFTAIFTIEDSQERALALFASGA